MPGRSLQRADMLCTILPHGALQCLTKVGEVLLFVSLRSSNSTQRGLRAPFEDVLPTLHSHLCLAFNFDSTEAPLMRCDPLQPKLEHLLAQCANPSSIISSLSRASSQQPLPSVVRIHKKRTFIVAQPARQEALEQRLAKRARTNDIKRRRLA